MTAPAGKSAIYSSATTGGYSGYLTGGTFYTTSLVKLANQVYFGSGLKSLLSGDQGGAIWLIGTDSTSTPYIDFRNLTTASGTKPDARIILDKNQKMNLYSPQGIVMNHDVTCQGSLSSSSNITASNSVRIGTIKDWEGQLQIYNGAANGPATILMQGGNAAGTGGLGRFWIVSQNNQLQLGKVASSVPARGVININSAGLVGINTDAPSKTLDVNGTLNATGNATFGGNISTTTGSITGLALSSTGTLTAAGATTIGTSAAPGSLTLYGTMGIGTTNTTLLSAYKLAVNGGIVATSMDINGTVPASDFVFEKTYKLRSLRETEAYVAEHKHLPEVPSAAEFKANGYNVGQMDDILLRKVEELTLYMIELQKQNEELKARLEKVENK